MNGGLDLLLLALAVVAIVGVFALRRSRGLDESRDERDEFRIRGVYARAIRQAGFESRAFVPIFWALKLIGALLMPLAVLELASRRGWAVPAAVLVLAALLGFFLADLWVFGLRRERQRRITWSLAYLLDLIVAFLRSGLGLEEAFRRAGRDGFPADHPLAQEVALVAREIDLGKDRAAAFRALYARTGVMPMKAIAAALESGLRLGASVEATLRAQAELLRTRRREDVMKRVQLAAVKALVPVVLCGLPLFAVIVFFPAFAEILRTFGVMAWAP
jgi:tight adherence protein C